MATNKGTALMSDIASNTLMSEPRDVVSLEEGVNTNPKINDYLVHLIAPQIKQMPTPDGTSQPLELSDVKWNYTQTVDKEVNDLVLLLRPHSLKKPLVLTKKLLITGINTWEAEAGTWEPTPYPDGESGFGYCPVTEETQIMPSRDLSVLYRSARNTALVTHMVSDTTSTTSAAMSGQLSAFVVSNADMLEGGDPNKLTDYTITERDYAINEKAQGGINVCFGPEIVGPVQSTDDDASGLANGLTFSRTTEVNNGADQIMLVLSSTATRSTDILHGIPKTLGNTPISISVCQLSPYRDFTSTSPFYAVIMVTVFAESQLHYYLITPHDTGDLGDKNLGAQHPVVITLPSELHDWDIFNNDDNVKVPGGKRPKYRAPIGVPWFYRGVTIQSVTGQSITGNVVINASITFPSYYNADVTGAAGAIYVNGLAAGQALTISALQAFEGVPKEILSPEKKISDRVLYVTNLDPMYHAMAAFNAHGSRIARVTTDKEYKDMVVLIPTISNVGLESFSGIGDILGSIGHAGVGVLSKLAENIPVVGPLASGAIKGLGNAAVNALTQNFAPPPSNHHAHYAGVGEIGLAQSLPFSPVYSTHVGSNIPSVAKRKVYHETKPLKLGASFSASGKPAKKMKFTEPAEKLPKMSFTAPGVYDQSTTSMQPFTSPVDWRLVKGRNSPAIQSTPEGAIARCEPSTARTLELIIGSKFLSSGTGCIPVVAALEDGGAEITEVICSDYPVKHRLTRGGDLRDTHYIVNSWYLPQDRVIQVCYPEELGETEQMALMFALASYYSGRTTSYYTLTILRGGATGESMGLAVLLAALGLTTKAVCPSGIINWDFSTGPVTISEVGDSGVKAEKVINADMFFMCSTGCEIVDRSAKTINPLNALCFVSTLSALTQSRDAPILVVDTLSDALIMLKRALINIRGTSIPTPQTAEQAAKGKASAAATATRRAEEEVYVQERETNPQGYQERLFDVTLPGKGENGGTDVFRVPLFKPSWWQTWQSILQGMTIPMTKIQNWIANGMAHRLDAVAVSVLSKDRAMRMKGQARGPGAKNKMGPAARRAANLGNYRTDTPQAPRAPRGPKPKAPKGPTMPQYPPSNGARSSGQPGRPRQRPTTTGGHYQQSGQHEGGGPERSSRSGAQNRRQEAARFRQEQNARPPSYMEQLGSFLTRNHRNGPVQGRSQGNIEVDEDDLYDREMESDEDADGYFPVSP